VCHNPTDQFLADGSSTKPFVLAGGHLQVTGEKNALLAAQAEKTPSKKSGEKDKGHMFGFGRKKSDKH
jgi:hypothetical protein